MMLLNFPIFIEGLLMPLLGLGIFVVYKRSSKPVMKGSRVETIEAARKEYAELLKEGWKKTSIFNSYF